MRISPPIMAAFLIGTSACSSGSPAQPPAGQTAAAVFAGGCFWCTEADFDKIPGVVATTSGYTGGKLANPTYKQVSAGGTGHIEAVRVEYDPKRISYAELVRRFLPTIDVTDGSGQFCDRGESYRPALFVANAEQRRDATAALKRINARISQPLAVAVLPAARFWPAEGYHQDYYKRNSTKYKFYRWKCGRDERLKQVWG
jgi:peptide-methionine (S)-S-oxide reductase